MTSEKILKSRKGEKHNISGRNGFKDNGDKYQAWDESRNADKAFCAALEKQFRQPIGIAKTKPRKLYNDETNAAFNVKLYADQLLIDYITASYPVEAR